MGPKPNDKCPHKTQKRRHRKMRKGQVKTEALTEVIHPQARECLDVPEAGKGKGA